MWPGARLHRTRGLLVCLHRMFSLSAARGRTEATSDSSPGFCRRRSARIENRPPRLRKRVSCPTRFVRNVVRKLKAPVHKDMAASCDGWRPGRYARRWRRRYPVGAERGYDGCYHARICRAVARKMLGVSRRPVHDRYHKARSGDTDESPGRSAGNIDRSGIVRLVGVVVE